MQKFQIKSNHLKQKRDKAKMILQPAQVSKIENCVKQWNESFECSEMAKDYAFIFQNAIEDQYISAKNFTNYSHYARIVLLLRLDDKI